MSISELCPDIDKIACYRRQVGIGRYAVIVVAILAVLERILPIEGGGCISHYVEESFWKRLWTCRLTDY